MITHGWVHQVTLTWLQKKKFQSHLKGDETKVSGLAEHLLFFAPFQIFPLYHSSVFIFLTKSCFGLVHKGLDQFKIFLTQVKSKSYQKANSQDSKYAFQNFLVLLSTDNFTAHIIFYTWMFEAIWTLNLLVYLENQRLQAFRMMKVLTFDRGLTQFREFCFRFASAWGNFGTQLLSLCELLGWNNFYWRVSFGIFQNCSDQSWD